MKIGIDARMAGLGHGIGRYTTEIVPRIIAQAPTHEYVLFVKNEEQRTNLQNSIQKHTNSPVAVQFVLVDIHWYTLREQLFFSSVIKKQKLDLMHFLHWNVPYFYSGDFVVTIHDLTMFHYARPEATTLGPITYWVKDRAHRALVKHIVRRAKHIFTPSYFVAEDIEKTFGNTISKTTVTHLAPFSQTNHSLDPEVVLQQFKLKKKKYLLYVGAAYPHKNILATISAWKQLTKDDPDIVSGYELILAGKPSKFYDRICKTIQLDDSIRYIGLVKDDELEIVYRCAYAFIFSSLSEGFGIPPLEAMSRNVPVVSSTHSCLPEVLGDAPVYTQVEDPQVFSQSLKHIMTDDHIRMQAIDRGRRIVRQYSWNRTAEQTIKVLKTNLKEEKL